MAKTSRNDGFYDAFINPSVKHAIGQYIRNNSGYEQMVDDYTLTNIYRNALARRIVTAPIDDSIKNGFKIKGDTDDKILQYMETINVEGALAEAGYWDRLYGRSCIFIIADDGGNADDPINFNKLERIKRLVVYDKRNIIEDMTGVFVNDDPNDDNFGKNEYYGITPFNGKQFYVHHSRLLMFNGETLPNLERIQNNGAGLPCLNGVIKAIGRNDTAHARALDIIERISQAVMKLNGMSELLQSEEGTEQVKRRLDLIDMARNLLNTIAIDKDDDFSIHNMSVAGVRELIQEFQQEISGMTSIPVTILFGRSPAGMNSTGSADFENYYNFVRRYQRTKQKPALEKLIKLIQHCKSGPTNGKELEDWQIEFQPLMQMSEKEQVELNMSKANSNKVKVETVQALVQGQLMTPEEARSYLFKETEIVPNEKLPEQKKQEDATQNALTNQ